MTPEMASKIFTCGHLLLLGILRFSLCPFCTSGHVQSGIHQNEQLLPGGAGLFFVSWKLLGSFHGGRGLLQQRLRQAQASLVAWALGVFRQCARCGQQVCLLQSTRSLIPNGMCSLRT